MVERGVRRPRRPLPETSETDREFVEVLRTLWSEDVSSFDGEFLRFEEVRSYPKPVRDRRVPIVLGGNSDGALERVAEYGDGWYGFNLPVGEVADRLEALHDCCRRRDRDPDSVEVAVSLRDGTPEDASRLAALGVSELVLVAAPPEEPGHAASWVGELADRWGIAPEPAG